jgi:NAD-dependent dihydropyrimidine dehydrogenase PreA subunit
MSLQQGLNGIWSPHVVANWAGCESSCNTCGQVCPTGAIRALPIEEKRHARIGLAIVNTETCLPYANREACQLCVDECNAAGYEAIEFVVVHSQTDAAGQPVPSSGYRAPVLIADKCVGCGLCQTRCFGINVEQHELLRESAIVIQAGEGKEDRMFTGSYKEAANLRANAMQSPRAAESTDFYIPQSTRPSNDAPTHNDDDPFGLE